MSSKVLAEQILLNFAPASAPAAPVPKKRGRPSSGVDRKKQLRQAARRHRERGGFRVRRLQVELPAGLYYNISLIAERQNETLRTTVTRLLQEAWKRDYVEKAVAEGSNRLSAEKVADSMIASHSADYERCFEEASRTARRSPGKSAKPGKK